VEDTCPTSKKVTSECNNGKEKGRQEKTGTVPKYARIDSNAKGYLGNSTVEKGAKKKGGAKPIHHTTKGKGIVVSRERWGGGIKKNGRSSAIISTTPRRI